MNGSKYCLSPNENSCCWKTGPLRSLIIIITCFQIRFKFRQSNRSVLIFNPKISLYHNDIINHFVSFAFLTLHSLSLMKREFLRFSGKMQKFLEFPGFCISNIFDKYYFKKYQFYQYINLLKQYLLFFQLIRINIKIY